jgi:hypothetical protein
LYQIAHVDTNVSEHKPLLLSVPFLATKSGVQDWAQDRDFCQPQRAGSRPGVGTERRFESLLGEFSEEYLERVIHGMQSWVSAGKEGNLKWAMFHYQNS